MEKRSSFLLNNALAAFSYGISYAALREINILGIGDINWIPMAALRFTALLLVPTRYWAALLVGEAASIGYQNYACLDQYGLAWVLTSSIPRMMYAIPIIYWLRRKTQNIETHISHGMGQLLLCMFLVSLAIGIHDGFGYNMVLHLVTGEQPIPLWQYVVRRVMINYLTILTITPMTLWLAIGIRQVSTQKQRRLYVTSVLRDIQWRSITMLLVVIALLTLIGRYIGDAGHFLALCGLFAALVVGATRYGWHSTALIGAAANMGVIILMPSPDDPLSVQVLGAITAFMTCALLLGSRTTSSRFYKRVAAIAEQGIEEAEERIAAAQRHVASAKRLARRELFVVERTRLDHASVLDGLFDDTRKQAIQVLHAVRPSMSPKKVSGYYDAFEALHERHQRITTSMSPMAWWQFGGEEGPIVEALNDIGVKCFILYPTLEDDAPRLSMELTPALYRLQCEAVGYLIKHAPTDDVRMHLRLDIENNRPLITTRVSSVGTPLEITKADYDDFLVNIGVAHIGERRLRERAQLYDGDLEIEPSPHHRMMITLRVRDKPIRVDE